MPKVGELILLAAPSCCGKTHFLEKLFGGQLMGLAAKMNIAEPMDSYVSLIPREVAAYGNRNIPRMILHFAIPTISLNDGSLQNLSDDPRLNIVNTSERVTVVTLLACPGVLASRLQLRYKVNRKLILRNLPKYFSERDRLGKLRTLYADPNSVILAYDSWFNYSESLNNVTRRYLISAEDDYRILPSTDWQRIKSSYSVDSR